jgi:hypothetical protein
MELERADALGLLRTKFVSLAAKAGLRNAPLLALERWRFAAKWAEDEPQMAAAAAAAAAAADPDADAGTEQQQQQGSKQSSRAQQASNQQKKAPKQQPGDPVVPFGSLPVAPEPGLVTDLMRAGVDAAAAVDVATQLARAAAQAAAGLVKKKQQLASGKEATCRDVIVTVHKHSLDLTCGGQFVKVGGWDRWQLL